MTPKLLIYRLNEVDEEPKVQQDMKQFDPTGNPELYFADITFHGESLRVFVDLEEQK